MTAPLEVSLLAAASTDIGPKALNEDNWAIQETRDGGQLLMLTDGMGGMGRGEEASKSALQVLGERLVDNDDDGYDAILSGIKKADEVVRGLGEGVQGRRPGTTAAIAYIQHGKVTVGWVGDSMVLLVRNGAVLTKNRSHRLVQKLIDDGVMTEETAKHSPMSRLLERSLGGREDDTSVKPGLLERWALKHGDYIVLCSDGLTDALPIEDIPKMLSGSDVTSLSRKLLENAKSRGIDDNTTVIVGAVVPGRAEGRLGDTWVVDFGNKLSLPPSNYRSGIVNAKALQLIERENTLPKQQITRSPGTPVAVGLAAGVVLLALCSVLLVVIIALLIW